MYLVVKADLTYTGSSGSEVIKNDPAYFVNGHGVEECIR